eukprot:TRINITY_DN4907_c0_g1_i1.p1 TRINITY_DN4907_c0_g1~~TRINITY_DN4907_c0_g1_i1.p1  ORF type:complete len:104 (-),score=21.10 TRINITY_DN4907_c0_g1_i1:113-400(-)
MLAEDDLETFVQEAQFLDRNQVLFFPPAERERLVIMAKRIQENIRSMPKDRRGEKEFELDALASHVLFEFVTKMGFLATLASRESLSKMHLNQSR